MLVTVVVTTYNRPQLVRRAIKSVLNQTYESAQIVVVEDGSNSGIDQWLAEQGLSQRVDYEKHEENRGLAAARNTGLSLAQGEYVAFLDDDDEWAPEFLTTLADVMSKVEVNTAVAYCGIEKRNSRTHKTMYKLYPRNRGNLKHAIITVGAATLSSSYLFSKSALIGVGGFDERLPSSVDHDIWMSLAAGGYHAVAVDEPLVVSYSFRLDRLTTDMKTRPLGVRMYLDKWMPSYQEWFGEQNGRAYAKRYFADVIGGLSADNLVKGKLSNAWLGIRQVFSYSGFGVGLSRLAWYASTAIARRVLPRAVVRFIKLVISNTKRLWN